MSGTRRRYQVTIQEGRWSLDAEVTCAERIGSEWVWTDGMPSVSLLATSETDRRAVLKEALVALIEAL